MNGALGRDGNSGKPAEQALANFASTPAGVLVFHIQDVVFHLERKLVGVPIGAATSVGQTLNTALLIAIENLIARLREMPNSLQSSAIASPASRRATNCTLSSVTEHSFQGITPSLKRGGSVTYVSGTNCHLCLRPLKSPTQHRLQNLPFRDNSMTTASVPLLTLLAQESTWRVRAGA